MRILIVIFVVLLYSCSKSIDQADCLPVKNNYSLFLIDTLQLTVPENSFPRFDQTFFYKNKFLFGYKAGSYRIEIYDFTKRAYFKSMVLDPNFFGELGAFYVHNFDSIFITQELTDVLLINSEGKILDKYDLSNAPLNWTGRFQNTEYFFHSRARSGPYYDSTTKILTVTFMSPEIWFYKNRRDFQMHGQYNIEKRSWEGCFGALPGVYSEEKIGYPFILSNPYCLVANGLTYISFPMYSDILVYQNTTRKLERIVCGESDHLILAKPFAYSTESNIEEQSEFIKTKGWYGELRYHPESQLFSRSLLLNTPEGSNTSPDIINKPVCVQFFDKNLNKVGEHLFDISQLVAGVGGDGFSSGFATQDGFIGSFKNSYYKNDDLLRYGVKFVIKKNNVN